MRILGIVSFILLTAVTFSISLNSYSGKATGADETVIAEFEWNGKHQITLEEMQQEIGELADYKQKQYGDKKGLEEYMTLMAESRLILCLAKDRNLGEEPDIQKKAQDYFHELMIDKITEMEVEHKLQLTEEDYRQYYEENKEEYVEPEMARLTCIALGDEERAKEVFGRITEDGEDIAEVAKELKETGELIGPGSAGTIPGDTSYFTRHVYTGPAQPVGDAAFALEIGQMHDEIITVELPRQTYHLIFRKDDYKPDRQQPFEEGAVQRRVKIAVERGRRDLLSDDWRAQLREQANVKTFIDRIPEKPPEDNQNEQSKS